MAAVPEDLRCKRSDGKQWRCGAPSMPGKTVCEKHYVQAKKRSASSALRATLRRSALAAASSAARLRDDQDEDAPPPMAVARPLYGRLAGEAVYVAEPVPAPARRGVAYEGLPLANAAGARTAVVLPDGLAAGARSCHQCRKPGGVIWCTSCDRRGYCAACIARCSIASGLAS